VPFVYLVVRVCRHHDIKGAKTFGFVLIQFKGQENQMQHTLREKVDCVMAAARNFPSEDGYGIQKIS